MRYPAGQEASSANRFIHSAAESKLRSGATRLAQPPASPTDAPAPESREPVFRPRAYARHLPKHEPSHHSYPRTFVAQSWRAAETTVVVDLPSNSRLSHMM